ncbi:MAG: LacI family transcriptional regulator [Rhodothermaceae bacterium]|nr:LacI family transcriptional regulator [Rhodothermaceae bacterium]
MKVTLREISESTGYSLSTVSRVLRGSDKYSAETVQSVLESAKKLKYPLQRIHATSYNRPYSNVSLITNFKEGEFYSSFYYGYIKAILNTDYKVSLISLPDPRAMLKECINMLYDQHFRGAILFIPEFTNEDYDTLLEYIPSDFSVVSNALIENPVLPTITFDGYSAGHNVAAHFHSKGYRTAGIVKGPNIKAEARYRHNGFRDYVTRNKGIDLIFESEGDFTYEAGCRAFDKYMATVNKPRSVFLTNDLMCHGFLESAKHAGLSVPGDVALAGYDDLPMCVHSHPTLTSVKTDFRRLAQTTLQVLNKQQHTTQSQIGILSLVPVKITARESS